MNEFPIIPYVPCVGVMREQIYCRQQGLISANIAKRSIGTVGAGAGSQLILDMAKHGVGSITSVDFDVVEPHNVPRTAYYFSDGLCRRPKVEALDRILREHCPMTEFNGVPSNYCELPEEERHRLFSKCDLLVYLADDFEAAALMCEDARALRIPAIFVGIQAQGLSGRIIYQIPDLTPCYRCVAHDRYEAELSVPEQLNLLGGECTLADVKFIDAVALKTALAILERREDTVYGAMGRALLKDGRNEIIVRTDPVKGFGSELWDAVLEDLPSEPKNYAQELRQQALFAMDTAWLKTEYRPDCDCSHCPRKAHSTSRWMCNDVTGRSLAWCGGSQDPFGGPAEADA